MTGVPRIWRLEGSHLCGRFWSSLVWHCLTLQDQGLRGLRGCLWLVRLIVFWNGLWTCIASDDSKWWKTHWTCCRWICSTCPSRGEAVEFVFKMFARRPAAHLWYCIATLLSHLRFLKDCLSNSWTDVEVRPRDQHGFDICVLPTKPTNDDPVPLGCYSTEFS